EASPALRLPDGAGWLLRLSETRLCLGGRAGGAATTLHLRLVRPRLLLRPEDVPELKALLDGSVVTAAEGLEEGMARALLDAGASAVVCPRRRDGRERSDEEAEGEAGPRRREEEEGRPRSAGAVQADDACSAAQTIQAQLAAVYASLQRGQSLGEALQRAHDAWGGSEEGFQALAVGEEENRPLLCALTLQGGKVVTHYPRHSR
ncbi:hypothetical protein H632_c4500p0, partial [Helicosporidium sp. ATCC 50920]